MSKIYLLSLGCSKNMVDSENMLGILKENGHEIVEYADEANYIIINTCSFIHDAKEESINSIIEAAELKKDRDLKIIVTGCLAQRYKDELLKEMPEIDILIGTHGYEKIDKLIDEYEALHVDSNDSNATHKDGNKSFEGKPLKEEKAEDDSVKNNVDNNIENNHKLKRKNKATHYTDNGRVVNVDIDETIYENLPRELLTPNYYAYMKISEGCSNRCTYCIIPKLRGDYRSRHMEDIIAEAEVLAKKGVKELILIAQDTSKYGIDIYGERKLHELIQKLSKIDGFRWIRIHYLYPEDFYDELINEFKTNNKLLKYFDIPLQHISDSVLKRMNRRVTSEHIKSLIEKIRREIPGSIIRTSLISGFPGETEEDHQMLIEFLKKYKLDRVGVFKYSREENTPAYRLDNQVDEEIKERRQEELMQLQQEISMENSAGCIGKTFDVIIDEDAGEQEYVGRTYMDAPDVDGCVFVRSERKLEIGNIYKVCIVDALEYDLIGDIEDENEFAK